MSANLETLIYGHLFNKLDNFNGFSFFQPYKNTADVLCRAASFFTAPICNLGLSGFVGLIALKELFHALEALLTKTPSLPHLQEAGVFAMLSASTLICSVASIFANPISFIGSAVTTLMQDNAEEKTRGYEVS